MKDYMLFTDTACLAVLYRVPTLLLPSRLWLVFCANLGYAICSLARQVWAAAACPIFRASECDRSPPVPVDRPFAGQGPQSTPRA